MTRRFDYPTLIALAALAYVLTTLLHEGAGHGGACLALGGRPVAWGAYYFDCDRPAGLTTQLVAAAGSTVNLIIALVIGPLLTARLAETSRPRGAGTVFLWLMFCLNAFTWAGYFLFSGLAGIGDWGTGTSGVLSSVSHPLPWRVGMAVFGGLAYFALGRVAGRLLGRILGGDDKQTGRKLAWTAYFTGGVLALLIGLLNPVGVIVVLISSLASSIGGTSGLSWLHGYMRPEPPANFALERSWPWTIAGAVAAAAYAWWLGPSITF